MLQSTQFDLDLGYIVYGLRDVERRPVLCSFKRIEGGSAYQKNLLRKIRLYICYSSHLINQAIAILLTYRAELPLRKCLLECCTYFFTLRKYM